LPFGLPDRSPGVPKKNPGKTQETQAKAGDRDDYNSWSSKKSVAFAGKKKQALFSNCFL
jgi:hypothetical protein